VHHPKLTTQPFPEGRRKIKGVDLLCRVRKQGMGSSNEGKQKEAGGGELSIFDDPGI